MSTKDFSGTDNFVAFIDDHSRKSWIYFLKTKDEVFDQFKEFKALVENLTRKRIKVLSSNNGGEYIDRDFTDFYARESIIRKWTTPYNPAQNQVAKRKNRAIVEAARAILYDQDMPKFLWAEACSTTVYVQKRTLHRALGNITPESVFTGKKPEYFSKRQESRSITSGGTQEEEQIDLPTTSGRTSRELRQILRDAKNFVGAPRNEKRERRKPDRYQALVVQVGEPSSFQEIVQHQVCVDALVEEYNSIMVNDVWEVVPRPQDKPVVGLRWIYKAKYVVDGSVEKYKAKFVAKGHAQKEGIDHEETFASVARYTSIRSMISLIAQMR
eukprot:PITA_32091